MRARETILRGWERWGEKMTNYWRGFFLILPKKIKGGKAGWQTVGDAQSYVRQGIFSQVPKV
jgi:hypothetical protein